MLLLNWLMHNIGSFSLRAVNYLVWFHEESDLKTGIKNNCLEIATLLADGLVCLCRSYRGISIKLSLFHNRLKLLVAAITSCIVYIYI